jgi:hypothetical protein
MSLQSYTCELCLSQREEKLRHLFFKCSYAKNYWLSIGVQVPTWLRPHRAIKHIKRNLRLPFAMEIIICMCWSIWTERDAWILEKRILQLLCVRQHSGKSCLVIHRCKKRYVSDLESWLQNLS